MEHIYGVRDEAALSRYRDFVSGICPVLDEYIEFLKKEYAVSELPRAIFWTDVETATHLISDIPVPAYTNDYRIVLTPDLDSWKEIYQKQLEGIGEAGDGIREYYRGGLSINHVMQILGHELTHHSDWFRDDDAIWFEEGMAEYISRRYFLTDEEYDAEKRINQDLVSLFREKFGNHSLNEFGRTTYEKDYAGIFYEYWRAFLAVDWIVAEHRGDVKEVFRSYHQWCDNGAGTLLDWFCVKI